MHHSINFQTEHVLYFTQAKLRARTKPHTYAPLLTVLHGAVGAQLILRNQIVVIGLLNSFD